MSSPDSLAELVSELRGLRPNDRQAVLSALTAAERSRITALLNRPRLEQVSAPQAESDSGLSPWLAACVRQARGGAGATGPVKMTEATSQLLVQAADAAAADTWDADLRPKATAAGRSLAGAIGEMLIARRVR